MESNLIGAPEAPSVCPLVDKAASNFVFEANHTTTAPSMSPTKSTLSFEDTLRPSSDSETSLPVQLPLGSTSHPPIHIEVPLLASATTKPEEPRLLRGLNATPLSDSHISKEAQNPSLKFTSVPNSPTVASTNDLEGRNNHENSGFVFPTYDAFLRELDEKDNNGADQPQNESENSNLDDIFSVFQNELNNLTKGSSIGRSNGNDPKESADYHCIRLTSQVFSNPYQILQITPETPDEDIKRKFRKISLLIHPDKCKHPNAQQAFQILSKANEQLQKPEMKKKYTKIIEEAKKFVLKDRVKENQLRKNRGEELLTEDLAEMENEIMERCEEILAKQEERRKYAEKTKAANERYEKEQEAKLIEESVKKREEKRKWEEGRDDRVNSWRSYKEMIDEKKIKLNTYASVRSYKEQRVGPPPPKSTFKSFRRGR